MKIDAAHNFNNFITDANLSVSGPTLANGDQAQGGGIAVNDCYLVVTNSTFTGNQAETGGAIYAYSSTVDISGSTFTDNEALTGAATGGAVAVLGNSTTTITDSTFSGNDAVVGGGVKVVGPLQVDSSLFTANTASDHGGGLVVSAKDPTRPPFPS